MAIDQLRNHLCTSLCETHLVIGISGIVSDEFAAAINFQIDWHPTLRERKVYVRLRNHHPSHLPTISVQQNDQQHDFRDGFYGSVAPYHWRRCTVV